MSHVPDPMHRVLDPLVAFVLGLTSGLILAAVFVWYLTIVKHGG